MPLLGELCGCIRPRTEEVRELDYRHTSLRDVPGEVFTFERTLEELHLDSNQISDLPVSLFHCHSLRHLGLSDNELQTLPPAVASLIHLHSLDVSKNAITTIPDNINGCKQLRSVDASVNPLARLPDGFTQLIALQELYLSDTFLEYLPANFGRLSRLRILELRENRLTSLPKSMSRLTHLQRLDLGQNDLSELPEVIASLTGLTELLCDFNKIGRLPALLGHLTRLQHLDASNNKITHLADEVGRCTQLVYLQLSANNLRTLPESCGHLTRLITLKLDDNTLTSVPESLGQITSLEELMASQNDLTRLPSSVGLLRRLTDLNLDDNLLLHLPPELGSCTSLRVLSVRNNRLTAVPAELGHLSPLRVLNLCSNRIAYLPCSFTKLHNLQALWLSPNQNKPLVRLQSETVARSGQRVLTCFMLPQHDDSEHDNDTAGPDTLRLRPHQLAALEADLAARSHIKFAFDRSEPAAQGPLLRAPTPYPKELKELAKHARNLQKLERRPRDALVNGEQVSPVAAGDGGGSPADPGAPQPTTASSGGDGRLSAADDPPPGDAAGSGHAGGESAGAGPPPYHIAAAHSRLAGEFASRAAADSDDRQHPLNTSLDTSSGRQPFAVPSRLNETFDLADLGRPVPGSTVGGSGRLGGPLQPTPEEMSPPPAPAADRSRPPGRADLRDADGAGIAGSGRVSSPRLARDDTRSSGRASSQSPGRGDSRGSQRTPPVSDAVLVRKSSRDGDRNGALADGRADPGSPERTEAVRRGGNGGPESQQPRAADPPHRDGVGTGVPGGQDTAESVSGEDSDGPQLLTTISQITDYDSSTSDSAEAAAAAAAAAGGARRPSLRVVLASRIPRRQGSPAGRERQASPGQPTAQAAGADRHPGGQRPGREPAAAGPTEWGRPGPPRLTNGSPAVGELDQGAGGEMSTGRGGQDAGPVSETPSSRLPAPRGRQRSPQHTNGSAQPWERPVSQLPTPRARHSSPQAQGNTVPALRQAPPILGRQQPRHPSPDAAAGRDAGPGQPPTAARPRFSSPAADPERVKASQLPLPRPRADSVTRLNGSTPPGRETVTASRGQSPLTVAGRLQSAGPDDPQQQPVETPSVGGGGGGLSAAGTRGSICSGRGEAALGPAGSRRSVPATLGLSGSRIPVARSSQVSPAPVPAARRGWETPNPAGWHKMELTIEKNPGLGFSIAGGSSGGGEPDKGIYISRVHADSPAWGVLRPGDRLLAVDGCDLSASSHAHAVHAIVNTGASVRLRVLRPTAPR